jgi:hypothetical protein
LTKKQNFFVLLIHRGKSLKITYTIYALWSFFLTFNLINYLFMPNNNTIFKVTTSLLTLGLILSPSIPGAAFSNNWQQGVSIQSRYNGDFGSEGFRTSLDRLAQSGADHVSLVVSYVQNGNSAVDIYAGQNTPTDEALISGISYAKSLGLEVSIKLFVESGQGWRAEIRPYDKNQWFANYTNIATKYGQLGQANGVSMIVLGTEMVGIASAAQDPANTGHWRKLIAAVRNVYTGSLTYGGNWGGAYNEKAEIEFWDALDYIGVSAYYEPGRYVDGNNVEALKGYWAQIDNSELKPLSQKWNKPIIFTEVGYRNIAGTTVDPWNFSRGGADSQGEQNAAYQALFEYFDTTSHLAGIHLWDWSSDPAACGAGNFDYTYCDKLAENVVKQYYAGASTPVVLPTTPAPQPVPTTSSTVPAIDPAPAVPQLPVDDETVNPAPVNPPVAPAPQPTNVTADSIAFGLVASANEALTVGQDSGLTVNVTNDSDLDVTGVNVDFEIYDASGKQVYQKYEENVSMLSGDAKDYVLDFVPAVAGDYTLKMGAFSSDWKNLLVWVDDLGKFQVTTTPAAPGTVVSTDLGGNKGDLLKIWWPSNGQSVSGLQPFKANVYGLNLDQYDMFWKVDGGVANPMGDSQTDYPHKEAIVDLSSWNWNNSGKYSLNFSAFDKAQKLIHESNVDIQIGQ